MIKFFKKKKQHPALEIAEAINDGDIPRVEKLILANPNIDRLTPNLGTWLHYAAKGNQLSVLKKLVSLGYDVNDISEFTGARPITAAAANAQNENVKYLISLGSELDVSKPEVNPLFAAIIAGRGRSEPDVMQRAQDTAKTLLDSGIDFRKIYSRDGEPYDAKIKAAEWGASEILELIKDYESRDDTQWK